MFRINFVIFVGDARRKPHGFIERFNGTNRAATEAPALPDEPPVTRVLLDGFFAWP